MRKRKKLLIYLIFTFIVIFVLFFLLKDYKSKEFVKKFNVILDINKDVVKHINDFENIDYLSQEEALQDFYILKKGIQEINPRPYLFISECDLFKLFEEFEKEIKRYKYISIGRFYKYVTIITASIRDTHTFVFNKNMNNKKLSFEFKDEKYYLSNITCNILNLKYPTEILKIDNIKISDMIKRLDPYSRFPNKAIRKSDLLNNFKLYYNIYNENMIEQKKYTYNLLVSDGINKKEIVFNENNTNNINMNNKKESEVLFDNGFKRFKSNKNLKIYINEEKKIAFYRLKKFIYNKESISLFDDLIDKMKLKGINNLIIDVRNNEGGMSNYIIFMLRMIHSKEKTQEILDCLKGYKIHRKKVVKSYIPPWKLKYKKIMIYDFFTKKSKISNINIYSFQNNQSYSAATLLSEIIKEYKLGKVVGKNSPEVYASLASPIVLKLKNSKIPIQISTAFLEKPYKGISYDRTVSPDIYIQSNDLNSYIKAVFKDIEN